MDTSFHLKHFQSEMSSLQSDDHGSESADEDFQPDNESEESDESDNDGDDGDDGEVERGLKCIFDASTLSKIHMCLSDATIPSWIE